MFATDQVPVNDKVRGGITIEYHFGSGVLHIAYDVVSAGYLLASQQIRIGTEQPKAMTNGP